MPMDIEVPFMLKDFVVIPKLVEFGQVEYVHGYIAGRSKPVGQQYHYDVRTNSGDILQNIPGEKIKSGGRIAA